MNKNRAKRVFVREMIVSSISYSGVVQIGDVETVHPFNMSRATGGFRGAPSFSTTERATPTKTRLHFANQRDRNKNDLNFKGDHLPNP